MKNGIYIFIVSYKFFIAQKLNYKGINKTLNNHYNKNKMYAIFLNQRYTQKWGKT